MYQQISNPRSRPQVRPKFNIIWKDRFFLFFFPDGFAKFNILYERQTKTGSSYQGFQNSPSRQHGGPSAVVAIATSVLSRGSSKKLRSVTIDLT